MGAEARTGQNTQNPMTRAGPCSPQNELKCEASGHENKFVAIMPSLVCGTIFYIAEYFLKSIKICISKHSS